MSHNKAMAGHMGKRGECCSGTVSLEHAIRPRTIAGLALNEPLPVSPCQVNPNCPQRQQARLELQSPRLASYQKPSFVDD